MMTDDLVRQRIKYLIEYGNAMPTELPSRNLMIRLCGAIILLQLIDLTMRVFS